MINELKFYDTEIHNPRSTTQTNFLYYFPGLLVNPGLNSIRKRDAGVLFVLGCYETSPPASIDLSASRGTLRGSTLSRMYVEWDSGGPQPCVFSARGIDMGSSASSSE